MRRLNFYLPDEQMKKLDKIRELSGLSISEILRRSIDDYADRILEHSHRIMIIREEKVTYDAKKVEP